MPIVEKVARIREYHYAEKKKSKSIRRIESVS